MISRRDKLFLFPQHLSMSAIALSDSLAMDAAASMEMFAGPNFSENCGCR